MKQKLLVYADFDWLKEAELIGDLSYENLRGSETYGFCFHKEWLNKHSDIILGEDLNNYSGWQYKRDSDIFGCFSDSLPDRWGRTLLLRKEQISAKEEDRAIKSLTSYDFLSGIDDYSRMGGFRFKNSPDSDFINNEARLRTPPLTSIRDLWHASYAIEASEERNELPEKRWIAQLEHPGTSLGGARPKANVLDEQKHMWISKFPSRKDTHDVGLWEHICNQLAREAGIQTAETRVIPSGDKYHVLLSKRFDRDGQNRRIHFASAMTATGLNDGDNHTSGHGYIDIVNFIIQGCTRVEENLKELYRRVAFNICIGNTDDHFRNHGFLLTSKGWTLSPAYDMNPTLGVFQSLLISSSTNQADLTELLNASEEYFIEKENAILIVKEVVTAIGKWRVVARRNQASQPEIDMFANRLSQGDAWLKNK